MQADDFGLTISRGNFEVKHIEGADPATAFWQRALERHTDGDFQEDVYEDQYCGTVTQQQFNSGWTRTKAIQQKDRATGFTGRLGKKA